MLKSKYLVTKRNVSKKVRHSITPKFRLTRAKFKILAFEDTPPRLKITKKCNYNRPNFNPLKKWLISKVGCNFDSVYSEYLTKIPTQFKGEYTDSIFNYLIPKTDLIYIDGNFYSKWLNDFVNKSSSDMGRQVYVNPITNIITKISVRKKQHLVLVYRVIGSNYYLDTKHLNQLVKLDLIVQAKLKNGRHTYNFTNLISPGHLDMLLDIKFYFKHKKDTLIVELLKVLINKKLTSEKTFDMATDKVFDLITLKYSKKDAVRWRYSYFENDYSPNFSDSLSL